MRNERMTGRIRRVARDGQRRIQGRIILCGPWSIELTLQTHHHHFADASGKLHHEECAGMRARTHGQELHEAELLVLMLVDNLTHRLLSFGHRKDAQIIYLIVLRSARAVRHNDIRERVECDVLIPGLRRAANLGREEIRQEGQCEQIIVPSSTWKLGDGVAICWWRRGGHVLGNQRPIGAHGVHPFGTAPSGPAAALPTAALPTTTLPTTTLPTTTQPATAHVTLPLGKQKTYAGPRTPWMNSTFLGQHRQLRDLASC